MPRAARLLPLTALAAALTASAGCGAEAPTVTETPATAVPSAPAADPAAPSCTDLVGAWRLLSYRRAETQVDYDTEGYMMFSKSHWTHVSFFNRDPRENDFSEAHHGQYTILGPNRLDLTVDMELHMDPKREFQPTPVWYGPPATVNSWCYVDGRTLVMDFFSGARVIIERIE
jgi:hypothetical protein